MRIGIGVTVVGLAAGIISWTINGHAEDKSAPAVVASGAEATPAPVNPFNGMQDRAEFFEFTQKPRVEKQGNTWIVSFASKAACDATVAITGTDGKIVRHLASGVLGKNAPWPFQQNSLAQKIEWDGLTDDFKKAALGCKIKVSLGLTATYERDISWDPAPGTYIEKDGKYFRTLFPPPADTPEDKLKECGLRPIKTVWGDRTFIGNRFGSFREPYGNEPAGYKPELKCMSILPSLFGDKAPPRKLERPTDTYIPKDPRDGTWYARNPRLAVSLSTEELYARGPGNNTIFRFDGKTGKRDKTWFPNGEFDQISEIDVGNDGLIYLRTSLNGYGRWLIRVDRTGKPVDFARGEIIPPGDRQVPQALTKQQIKGVFTGVHGHSNIHQKGFGVSPNGHIVSIISEVDAKWAEKKGLVKGQEVGAAEVSGFFVVVWDNDGQLLTVNAVEGSGLGHGVRMDREGNIFLCQYGYLQADQKGLDGVPDVRLEYGIWGGPGSLFKFRGLGDKFPVGKLFHEKDTPADATKLAITPQGMGAVIGAQWVYGSVINQGRSCSCNHGRFDLDGYARSWVPANQLCSVMVLDANGNRIARIGKYGNVDDEGIRFAWVRAVAASDSALYAMDFDNRRILKAALSYAAEETVSVP